MATLSQAPGTLNITCSRGDDLTFRCTFTGLNLTGYTFEAAVRHNNGDTAMTVTETDLENGVIDVSLTDTDTAAIPSTGLKTWYLKWTTNGNTRTVLAGEFEFS